MLKLFYLPPLEVGVSLMPIRRQRKLTNLLSKFVNLSWRSGRDSNPRGIAPKLISSQPRYDRFDTAAYKIVKSQTLENC